MALDWYTHNRFSKSMGSLFGGTGQKALQAMNETKTCTSQEFVKMDLYPLSLISLRYAICSTGHWSIIHVGHCIGACQRSNCAEER